MRVKITQTSEKCCTSGVQISRYLRHQATLTFALIVPQLAPRLTLDETASNGLYID